MAEQKAKTDKTEAEARKANAEADRAEIEAQILKEKLDAARQALAEAHMNSIRNIEEHDHAIEGMVQDRHHAQDAHGAAMVNQGLAARAAMAAQDGDGADVRDRTRHRAGSATVIFELRNTAGAIVLARAMNHRLRAVFL
jgi:hypothetical protein